MQLSFINIMAAIGIFVLVVFILLPLAFGLLILALKVALFVVAVLAVMHLVRVIQHRC
jgi:phosphoglycerol transferase MdoB-like AlkP superfamily enzyme